MNTYLKEGYQTATRNLDCHHRVRGFMRSEWLTVLLAFFSIFFISLFFVSLFLSLFFFIHGILPLLSKMDLKFSTTEEITIFMKISMKMHRGVCVLNVNNLKTLGKQTDNIPTEPPAMLQNWSVDLKGPIHGSGSEFCYILVATEHVSHYME